MFLTNAGFSDFERIIITCVDSEYPVASLGDEFAQLDVAYTASHEQRTRMATARLNLKNQGDGSFKPIHPEEVCECLDSGSYSLRRWAELSL
jgi:hypothetical protein